ncbi:MAG: nodulation protein NfeD [Bacteroidota bacterium]|nr:nodulation protein NfeD [Bacteroidota bacterium]
MIINKIINSTARVITTSLHYLLTLLFLVLVSGLVRADADSTKLVYKIDVREEIGPGIARKMSAALNIAQQKKADLVIIHLNTYGGTLDAADTIRTRLLNLPIPVIAFIDNNAASAGALISIACNRIYMRSGASIGAATVVNMNAEALPDKYQSYMRSMMRSTAEKRGRDPRIAEAMVDPRTFIPGVNDSGKVLTFTTSEAIKNGYCEGEAESIEAVLAKENIGKYTMETYVPTLVEKIISLLVNPAVSGILLLLMLGGIYFELQTPGIGFPLLAAATAAILYFAPLYLEGLAANWEILMAVAGFILLAVEILVLPGFGVAGISGIVLLVSAFTFSMIGNDGLNFDGIAKEEIVRSLAVVVISMFSSILLSYFLGKRLLTTSRFGRMVLQGGMQASEGYVSSDLTLAPLVGSAGFTQSFLRPSGKIIIGQQSYSANAESGFIEAGKKVVVTRFDGLVLWVKEEDIDA